MPPLSLKQPAEALLAEGFAQRCVRWAQHDKPSLTQAHRHLLHQACSRLSLASSAGHVCLPLSELCAGLPSEQYTDRPTPHQADSQPLTLAALREVLLNSGVVGISASPGACPMILDDQDRLYLHRFFDYEKRLARRLLQSCVAADTSMLDAPAAGSTAHAVRDALRAPSLPREARPSVSPDQPTQADRQKLAVALALLRRLTVISGGPGTGKTTTVVTLLSCLLQLQPQARIALTAPTGKAAARMYEALRARAAHLPESVRQRLPESASTLHRLLGVRADGSFVYHAGHRLPVDVLIVDEASMLDLALATHLLEAMPEQARIVLLGDKDQLASVEAGAVFAELSRHPVLFAAVRASLADLCSLSVPELDAALPAELPTDAAHPGMLTDAVVWLDRNYRFSAASGIGLLAQQVRDGDAQTLIASLTGRNQGPAAPTGVHWIADTGPGGDAQLWAALTAGYTPLLQALNDTPHDVGSVTAAFNRFRALCAVRAGPRGNRLLNLRLSDWLRRQTGASPADPWFSGQALIVRMNDYTLGLFNGDVGLVLPDRDGRLVVWFSDDTHGFRPIAPARLPAHELAFALTIHTSQGSEFERVAVILPEAPNRVASRELLYTGITRAREHVLICAPEPALQAAIDAPTRRDSGLLDRLAELRGD
jgi:exodeoxyribonuclease V alpha subunit